MKKSLLSICSLPLIIGSLFFHSCGQTWYEQVSEKLTKKEEINPNDKGWVYVKREKSLESYFPREQELDSLSPIRGISSKWTRDFPNLEVCSIERLGKEEIGEEYLEGAKDAARLEYNFPDGKKMILMIMEFNSPLSAKEIEKKINPEEDTSPNFAFLDGNVLTCIAYPDIPSFQSYGLMPEQNKVIFGNFMEKYSKRIKEPIGGVQENQSSNSQVASDSSETKTSRENNRNYSNNNTQKTVTITNSSKNKKLLENYLFQESELNGNAILDENYGFQENIPNPFIEDTENVNSEYKETLNQFKIESIASGKYLLIANGAEDIMLSILKFKDAKEIEKFLVNQQEDFEYIPIFKKGKVISLIEPGINEIYFEGGLSKIQQEAYTSLIFGYLERTGMKIQFMGEGKEKNVNNLLIKMEEAKQKRDEMKELRKNFINE